MRMVATGEIREAYDRFVDASLIHHNPWFPGDPESLLKGMEENATKNPGKILDVKRVLEDGDLVAVHSHMRPAPDAAGVALVHIFRFTSGKIAELWDIGQPVPNDSPNKNGMF